MRKQLSSSFNIHMTMCKSKLFAQDHQILRFESRIVNQPFDNIASNDREKNPV